jgi:hypothetical protein
MPPQSLKHTAGSSAARLRRFARSGNTETAVRLRKKSPLPGIRQRGFFRAPGLRNSVKVVAVQIRHARAALKIRAAQNCAAFCFFWPVQE